MSFQGGDTLKAHSESDRNSEVIILFSSSNGFVMYLGGGMQAMSISEKGKLTLREDAFLDPICLSVCYVQLWIHPESVQGGGVVKELKLTSHSSLVDECKYSIFLYSYPDF